MDNYRTTAIVLAAGQGKRMNCDVHKQYLLINDKPVLYYSLKVFEDSFIDDVVLVVGKGEEEYCRKEIIERYSFTKIRVITEGGKERYHSVANGINAITWKCDFVFVHDGARPFINNEILERAYDTVKDTQACVVGMPVKDTIKIVDEKGFVTSTPPRAFVWQVQTPQVFSYELINYSYNKLIEEEANLLKNNVLITDDAMVIEYFAHKRVKIVEGSYQNIKITTFEDLGIAKSFLS
ncbi:MAG: 2-C-methyl-D-erythritol 4-phosphate cytidylyltransferase [Lachnospiraceae bacterium]|nr:2-C-methyl-D-erythritol 4-phosphate cytidylyltransferase [Lachnospiraceae bacterium]MBQ2117133.1 2-C-methyl-D-erythritol 4-phosphate cytidylyltransferase [Lachnospiraceae bacterium]MBQ2405355.1 2-C-methyl-D-erythritol 4-phosphate cytidylyltransferase [Lachnospiraceae bacterium]MEE0918779.1 2-C-methyl-D-erythritol 4-phosphate cytidylyltransferase [Lachnospiraceae bacterium]